jgi:hypothetical protein
MRAVLELAFADPSHAHGLDQLIDRAGRSAWRVHLYGQPTDMRKSYTLTIPRAGRSNAAAAA